MFWDPFGPPRRRRPVRPANEDPWRVPVRPSDPRRQPPQSPPEPPRAAEPPPPQAPDPLAQLVAEFEKEVAAARRERDEWEDKYRHLQEETAPMRQRLQRNAEERAFEANRATLRRFLDVADNLERALSAASSDQNSLVQGIELTYRQLQRALIESGVTPIESVGQPFDPELHEAVAAVEASEQPAGTVVRELQRGYRFQEKLLRPAQVVIAQ